MSQAAVERALGKLVTDEAFRERFFQDPAAATFRAGLELSKPELDALSRLSRRALTRFGASLDDRICRLSLDEKGQATPAEHRGLETDRPTTGSSGAPGAAPRPGKEGGGEQPTSLDGHG